jgi:type VI secretion system protein ImpA
MDALTVEPIAADAPCGPDLDLEGDSEFLNFMAAYEGQLPSSYFAFDRKSIDFAAAFAAAEPLLKRTHDIRLYVLLAKLAILNRDLDGFVHWIMTTDALLTTFWNDVHPRAEEGDFGARLAQLSTLNDNPLTVLPLQYAPLVDTQREGQLVFRSQLIELGEVKPREGENLPGAATIGRILEGCDLAALDKRTGELRGLCDALASIEKATIEGAGYELGVKYPNLRPLAVRIRDFLQAVLARRDPNAAPPEGEAAAGEAGAAGAGPAAAAGAKPGKFANLAEAEAALAAAHGYFLSFEPSSPALMLVGQARESLGKTLYEVLKLLAPNHADAARIFVGRDSPFPVPVSSQANTPSQEIARAVVEPAPTRADALALIDAVGAHFRVVEPSSPAPLLLERAKALATRDFVGLLSELLSEDALNSMKSGS